MPSVRVPRALHPVAWWLWALGLATAVSRTTNPLVLLLVLAVLGLVIANRRSDAPWARAFRYYLWLALVVVAIRVVFRSIFVVGVAPTDHLLFTLPRAALPQWYAGVHLGGPVSLEAVLSAGVDGMRLGTMLCCIGAANTLANPKRALRVLPGALYELGVAVTVALSVAPQLAESVQRVRRARRLRAGTGRGVRALRGIAIPVLEDAFERSLRLAAAMDSRGYGRTGTAPRHTRRVTAVFMLGGLLALCAGMFGLLDAEAPGYLGVVALATGGTLCTVGLAVGGRRVQRTSYRPDQWSIAEWLVAGSGVLCAALVGLAASLDPAGLDTSFSPLQWPTLPLIAVLGVLLSASAALTAPPPVRHPVITTRSVRPAATERVAA